MKEKKSKIQKIKEQKSLKERASSLVFAGIALVLAIAMFLGLVTLQDTLTNNIIYQQVIAVKVNIPGDKIPEGEVITKENANKYFALKNVNTLDATTGYMTDINDIIGCKTRVPLLENEIISAKDFENLNEYISNIENPIEISISIADLADADGGKIRSGDLVNLTMMYSRDQLRMGESYAIVNTSSAMPQTNLSSVTNNTLNNTEEETTTEEVTTEEGTEEAEEISTETNSKLITPKRVISPVSDMATGSNQYTYEYYGRYIAENLYVKTALDASGAEITPADTTAVATVLIFIIDKKDEPEFNNAIANCTNKRISKVIKAMENVTAPNIEIATEETTEAITLEAATVETTTAEETTTEEVTTEEGTEEISTEE